MGGVLAMKARCFGDGLPETVRFGSKERCQNTDGLRIMVACIKTGLRADV